MLDPTNDVNARDGFSAAEIRAAFLRFFVSIFRGYLPHVVMPTNTTPYPEKLFNKEAFLKSCGHLVSELVFVYVYGCVRGEGEWRSFCKR